MRRGFEIVWDVFMMLATIGLLVLAVPVVVVSLRRQSPSAFASGLVVLFFAGEEPKGIRRGL